MSNHTLKKEAAWVFSNLSADSPGIVQKEIECLAIKRLSELALTDSYDVKRESVWALANACITSIKEQINSLIEANVPEALCGILSIQDPRTISIALEGLESLLKKGETTSVFLY